MTITRLRRLAVIGGTALVLAACTDEKQDVLTPEGDRARDINELQIPVFAVAGVVGLLVVGLILLGVALAGRRRSGPPPAPETVRDRHPVGVG